MTELEEQFNFTNKRTHPTNRKVIVYRHLVQEQADYFAELLIEDEIDFEVQIDEEHQKKPIYYGVARVHEKRSDHLNLLSLGKNRPLFIDSAVLRWIVIGGSALFIFLGILGAIVSNLAKF